MQRLLRNAAPILCLFVAQVHPMDRVSELSDFCGALVDVKGTTDSAI